MQRSHAFVLFICDDENISITHTSLVCSMKFDALGSVVCSSSSASASSSWQRGKSKTKSRNRSQKKNWKEKPVLNGLLENLSTTTTTTRRQNVNKIVSRPFLADVVVAALVAAIVVVVAVARVVQHDFCGLIGKPDTKYNLPQATDMCNNKNNNKRKKIYFNSHRHTHTRIGFTVCICVSINLIWSILHATFLLASERNGNRPERNRTMMDVAYYGWPFRVPIAILM